MGLIFDILHTWIPHRLPGQRATQGDPGMSAHFAPIKSECFNNLMEHFVPKSKAPLASLLLQMLFRVRYNEPAIRNGVDLEPGQLLLGLDEISEKAGISRETTRRILKKLETLEVITKKATPQGQIISFCSISNYIMTRAETNNQATTIHPPKPQVTVVTEEALETQETIAPPPQPLTNGVVGENLKKDNHTIHSTSETQTPLTNNRLCPVPRSTAEWRDLISTERMRSEKARDRFDAAKKLALLVDRPEIFTEIFGKPLLEPEPDFCANDLYAKWMDCTTARTVPHLNPEEFRCILSTHTPASEVERKLSMDPV